MILELAAFFQIVLIAVEIFGRRASYVAARRWRYASFRSIGAVTRARVVASVA